MSEAEVLFENKGGIGFITLNRPAALNALTLNMARLMNERLEIWEHDPQIRAVVVAGAGGKAFCSGGDVKAVALDGLAARAGQSNGDLGRDFFREEYTLNFRIQRFPKPYIALIDGIVMGGGKGISAHGSHRVVSEKTLFAMPETSIGFFPDVGGGYFLPRCPGQTGLYLALTSARVGAADALAIGFATHFVASVKFPDMIRALADIKWTQDAKSCVDAVLARFSSQIEEEAVTQMYRAEIDRCFSFNRIEEIILALVQEKTPWADETLKSLALMSPFSLKLALRQIRAGAKMNFAEVMTMEYRLSQACMRLHDFYEGIRAALIDKDRNPQWNPARLEDVSDLRIEECFQSLGPDDLLLGDVPVTRICTL